ncbi:hypothetical protein Clacol_004191 [Clathrus columnatus]|uniref:BHLH domain-containing protein n=1 Tax=Clathrus columnatus TaxID=1419009 RepID=A0AAV5ABW5_9AGAM|nr:hypothetical protein Clacol_004191 [Clathrus columnatus]
MDHHHDTTDPGLTGTPYGFYTTDDGYTTLPYAPPPQLTYHHLQNSQDMMMRPMNMLSLQPQSQGFQFPGSPTRLAAGLQLPPSPSPVNSVNGYDHPISPPISGSDASTDSQTPYHTHAHGHSYSRESSSGAGSPPARRSHSHRYHPVGGNGNGGGGGAGGGAGRRGRRSSTNDEQDLSDDGEHDPISPQSLVGNGLSGQALAETLANSRKEATRKQRIEAEQRRRDELREGYARLKNVLPSSNQKSSKVSLLERATNYIANIDQSNKILLARLAALETEVARLREINERLSMTVAHHTGQMPTELDLGLPPPMPQFDENSVHMDGRPLSPPPDVPTPSASAQQHAQPQMRQQQQQQQQEPPQSHMGMYHHSNDSSASASQASGSEY